MEPKELEYEKYQELYERLDAYAKTDYYPFHMPGHKRAELNFCNPYKIDLTEIEGFDNLHHAEEILLKSQERLSKLYQSIKSYYLINGSTCGILSAVGALTKPKDRIIMARNCHKAVYHAAKLFGLKTEYVYPRLMECGIQGEIDAGEVERAFQKYPDASLVVLPSPTFDGIVSEISKIAGIAHRYGAYCIVDEAHGAHFSLSSFFPESAVRQNADLVIQSLHKTLPSFTQTAALHIASDRVDISKVEEMLGIFQSSSPSYILMGGIDRCIGMLERSGKQLFEQYAARLASFYKMCENLKYLHVLAEKDYETYQVPGVDRSKIVILTENAPIDGVELYQLLLYQYHLQMEMFCVHYVLGMTSIMDTQEGFERLAHALLETDRRLGEGLEIKRELKFVCAKDFLQKAYAEREKVMEISEATYYNKEEVLLADSIGKICAESIYLYPPGIPMIVPGEVISEEMIEVLAQCQRIGLHIQGMQDKKHQKIVTVK